MDCQHFIAQNVKKKKGDGKEYDEIWDHVRRVLNMWCQCKRHLFGVLNQLIIVCFGMTDMCL